METNDKTLTPLVLGNQRYSIVIPEDVERLIRHLCNKIHHVEWSGTLFYTVEGNFEDGSLKVICKDIYVQDIGTSTFTEFDMAPDVMGYMVEKDLMDCQSGLVHSHAGMATFFSGTDTDTLRKEGNDRNHFVSLIVNNEGTYTAAITRKLNISRTIKDCYSYESFDGVEIKDCNEEIEKDVTEIQYFYLDIVKEGTSYDFTDIDRRLNEIQETKKAKVQADKEPNLFNYKRQEFPKFDTAYNYYRKGSLFEKEEEVEKNPIEDTSYDKLVKSIAMQLLTGSVMITADSNIDIKKYVEGLEGVVMRRFGPGEEGFKRYDDFIDFFAETVLYDAVKEEHEVIKLAEGVYNYINALPKNKYVMACLDKLSLFV